MMIAASVFWKPAALTETRKLIPPPPRLEYLSFGFQMPIADSLWLRSIQDFDYCENRLATHLCEGNGWLFKMMDAVTTLAPDYLAAYRNGALALTVLVSDYPGASIIFDRGVQMFPEDRILLYRAAYHAMLEEKKNDKAADLLIRAAKAGGKEWFYNLAARLYSDSGQKDLAEGLYEELKASKGVSEATLQRMRDKIDGKIK